MTTTYLKYEHPLNEKMRIFLRIEYLWQQLESSLQMEGDTNCIMALNTLLQLLEINERADLKSEAIKYLDKLIVKFHKIKSTHDINKIKVEEILTELVDSLSIIKKVSGKISACLYSNDWLATIRQKLHTPGGFSGADLPFLAYWQKFPLANKIKQLSDWKEVFYPLAQAVNKILFFIRKTNVIYEIGSSNGNYQKIIENQFEPQLIIVDVPAKLNIYPEISGNRYRVAIRFLQTDMVHKARLFDDRVEFKLSVCW